MDVGIHLRDFSAWDRIWWDPLPRHSVGSLLHEAV